MSFAQVTPRKRWLDGHVVLARRLEHARFRKIETFSPRNHLHAFRLEQPSDVDARSSRGCARRTPWANRSTCTKTDDLASDIATADRCRRCSLSMSVYAPVSPCTATTVVSSGTARATSAQPHASSVPFPRCCTKPSIQRTSCSRAADRSPNIGRRRPSDMDPASGSVSAEEWRALVPPPARPALRRTGEANRRRHRASRRRMVRRRPPDLTPSRRGRGDPHRTLGRDRRWLAAGRAEGVRHARRYRRRKP